MKQGELQWAGFHLAGMVCLVLLVVKLTLAFPWSWWRVMLPLWTVLLRNGLYIAVGFICLTWMGAAVKTMTMRFDATTSSLDISSEA